MEQGFFKYVFIMMLTEFLKIIEEKSEYDRNNPWYVGSETYLEGIADEIKEVKAEMRDENQIFLTDELTDILWDYLNLLSSLKKEGKIESIEAVIQHAERKYGQRIAAVKES